MNAMLLLSITLAAPGLKEPAAKDQNIVGEWVAESILVGGQARPPVKEELRYVFTVDGKWRVIRGDRKLGDDRGYHTNLKASPPNIDLILDLSAQKSPAVMGIFKVEGNTLTLCIDRTQRPTSFEAPLESPATLYVFKRAKAKE